MKVAFFFFFFRFLYVIFFTDLLLWDQHLMMFSLCFHKYIWTSFYYHKRFFSEDAFSIVLFHWVKYLALSLCFHTYIWILISLKQNVGWWISTQTYFYTDIFHFFKVYGTVPMLPHIQLKILPSSWKKLLARCFLHRLISRYYAYSTFVMLPQIYLKVSPSVNKDMT